MPNRGRAPCPVATGMLVLLSAGAAHAGITSATASNGPTNVVYSFQYTMDATWHRAFVDVDRRADTGFAIAGAGAEFLLENGRLHRHVGPGWAWKELGTVPFSTQPFTASWIVARRELGDGGCATSGTHVVFQVESEDKLLHTSARFAHDYVPCASPLYGDRVTNDEHEVVYKFQHRGAWRTYEVLIDADGVATTGHGAHGIGAEFRVTNGTLFRYEREGKRDRWTEVQRVPFTSAGGVASWSVPRAALGETGPTETATVVYRIASGSRTAALPPRTHLYWSAQKLAVPSYFAPCGEADCPWSRLEAAGAKVGFAIINPASGPGAGCRGEYAAQVRRTQRAGVGHVIGYVATGRGEVPLETAKADVDRYYECYGTLDGIFFDEGYTATCDAPRRAYYRALRDHVKAKGGKALVVLNPGTAPVEYECFVADDVADVFVLMENDAAGYTTASVAEWATRYPASRFAHLVHGAPAADVPRLLTLARRRNAGWFYATEDTLPNPWDTLPAAAVWRGLRALVP